MLKHMILINQVTVIYLCSFITWFYIARDFFVCVLQVQCNIMFMYWPKQIYERCNIPLRLQADVEGEWQKGAREVLDLQLNIIMLSIITIFKEKEKKKNKMQCQAI